MRTKKQLVILFYLKWNKKSKWPCKEENLNQESVYFFSILSLHVFLISLIVQKRLRNILFLDTYVKYIVWWSTVVIFNYRMYMLVIWMFIFTISPRINQIQKISRKPFGKSCWESIFIWFFFFWQLKKKKKMVVTSVLLWLLIVQ